MAGNLLIVIKDVSELRRLRELLSSAGYDILTANDWETAYRISDSLPVELVLCEGQTLLSMKPFPKSNTDAKT